MRLCVLVCAACVRCVSVCRRSATVGCTRAHIRGMHIGMPAGGTDAVSRCSRVAGAHADVHSPYVRSGGVIHIRMQAQMALADAVQAAVDAQTASMYAIGLPLCWCSS